ncbi:Mannosyl-glycoprotein endo-beta-N-acetylglucosaminidase, family GH85 [Ectocarpus siliculosus]|uniref:Mannosyl-glycoprotein endo-beta-N-acetylglucosaminidase, family GH85 n=1 Tax=Ectocarpus siliculosus TaxID=2880 RepID=D8LQD7_ECTSI|nr:Mannosyl-glycoprotein endo-beta-N-acetylglucosaminidase, family GH85 [Ectocarpus siliculosus]|eukprot:CBN78701.1 Mannosyl-glycoprotein endo-beta-N-acetylglucosaminidase, family GH85 [Ectocarpus siliculosus]
MTFEWAKADIPNLLMGVIFCALIWPQLMQVSAFLRQSLYRATAQERERTVTLQALHERQEAETQREGEHATAAGRRTGATTATASTAARAEKAIILPQPQPRRAKGAPSSRSPSPSPSPEILPLTTLGELLSYEGPGWGQGFAPARPLPFVAAPFPPLKSRLLVCHDLAGGYGQDRLVQGGGYDRPYRAYDWGLIDIFVYFSHDLVTIPTAGWIDVAHRHGTRVLGTFITEWDKGYDVCEELLRSEETADRAAAKLTQIAVDHGFDGWLVNIENKVDPGERVDVLAYFLRSLTAQMRAATLSGSTSVGGGSSSSTAAPVASGGGPEDGKPGTAGTAGGHSRSTVLWYDSVTVEGKLEWQDRLNGENRVFFDACDGIFSNYAWKADYPSACALEAQARRYDVYMGIDTFGRGTWGGGGFDVDKALGKIRRAGVSAALFAPAWTMEEETTGGGRVDPDPGRGGWQEVEQEFSEIDTEFWSKIAAVWQPPRSLPGGGRGGAPLLPLVVNFGHGLGNAWRIRGEEVAVFRASRAADDDATGEGDKNEGQGDNDADNDEDDRLVVGGAFYDLASQCLTPLVGGRGGPVNGGLRSDVVKARRAGDSSDSQGGANGTIRATYSFAESFDGTSSLRFTGVLNEKATASFPLYSCDVPLPADPLEIRLTFCGNADSDMALLLSLDVPGQLGGRREVVLRDWGKEGAPKKQQAVFSKRLTFTDTKATYCPVREESDRALSATASAEYGLQARVRALRDAGEPYDAIRTRLREERSGGAGVAGADSPSSAAATGASPSSTWITRTYVVRDLRMGGSRAIREVSLVCARRNKLPTLSTQEEGGEKAAAGSAWSALRGGRRLEDSGGGGSNAGGKSGAERRGVAGLAAYRAFLGEVAIGPWRRETPSTFGRVEGLRAKEVACFYGEGETGGGGGGGVTVDLSLAWESEGCVGRGRGFVKKDDGVFGAGSPWTTLHCDIWGAYGGEEEGGGGGSWRWLGRAYGQKYRLTNLRVGGGGGCREGGATGEAASGSSLVLAVQQVNAMGYREPVEDWARLHLCLP